MSALNLQIDPQIVASQAVMFFVGIALVKRLMLDPYLQLREKRESLTFGDKDQAKEMSKEASLLRSDVDAQIKEALTKARTSYEDAKTNALRQQALSISAAKEQSQTTLDSLRKKINEELETQKLEVDKLVDGLSIQVFDEVAAGA